jgi:hypothetical protein
VLLLCDRERVKDNQGWREKEWEGEREKGREGERERGRERETGSSIDMYNNDVGKKFMK